MYLPFVTNRYNSYKKLVVIELFPLANHFVFAGLATLHKRYNLVFLTFLYADVSKFYSGTDQ